LRGLLGILLTAFGLAAAARIQASLNGNELAIEVESARFRGGQVEEKPAASGGKLLGGGWGADLDHFAELEFRIDAPIDASIGIRYAYDQEQFLRRFPGSATPHAISVSVDGKETTASLDLPDTSDWNVFSVVTVSVGKLAAGPHRIRLAPVWKQGDVNLDQVVIVEAGSRQDTRVATLWPTRSRHFRLRLSPRVDPQTFPARNVFTNLEAQYAFHRDWLGFEPKDPGLLTVVAPADWNAGSATAYTNQGLIYLQEREALHPGDNYAHEMLHMFEAGLDYPTWWSEGMAFLLAVRSDAEIYGRPQADIDRQLQDLRAWWSGEGESKLVREGRNALALWGSDRVPKEIQGRELYRAANLLLYSLWLQEGDGLFKRIYRQIQTDRSESKYRIPGAGFEEKNRLLIEYVLRAAAPERREAVRKLLENWRMPLPG
jgi:hypothetical protein